MKLTPWKQRAQVSTLQTDFEDWMKEFFDNGFSRLPKVFQEGPIPAINLAEDTNAFVVTVELPGMKKDEIDIQVIGDQLVISGERKWEEEKKGKEYYRVESQYGSFRRAIQLPSGLNHDPDAIAATCENGVLEVHVPKLEPRPASRIKVKGK